MKKSFKKSSFIVLLLAIVSATLVGCGTDKDSGGMGGKTSSLVSPLK